MGKYEQKLKNEIGDRKYTRGSRTAYADDSVYKRNSASMLSKAEYRNMLSNITKMCYIESVYEGHGGSVAEIIRDRAGIPVCFKVLDIIDDTHYTYDYVAAGDVWFYEPYDIWVPNDAYFDDFGRIDMDGDA